VHLLRTGCRLLPHERIETEQLTSVWFARAIPRCTRRRRGKRMNVRLSYSMVLLGVCLLTSCAHQRSSTLRVDQKYDIPCSPCSASVRVGDDGFISFTYTISSTEVLEVQCKGQTTFVGQVVPTMDGRDHHVTAYDGTEWKTTSVSFTEPAKPKHGIPNKAFHTYKMTAQACPF